MRNISLLPLEIRLYRKSAKKWNVFIIVMGAALAVLIMIYLLISAFMLIPRSELNGIKEERINVQSQIEELKPYEVKLNNALAVKELVTGAMGVNPEWGSFFAGLYNKMPDNVWLSDFTVSYKDQSGDYDIKGTAKSHYDVAEWLKELQKADGINDVQCQFTAKTDAKDGSSTSQFEIKAKVLPGKAYEPAVEGGTNP